jgi:hypothetical protein
MNRVDCAGQMVSVLGKLISAYDVIAPNLSKQAGDELSDQLKSIQLQLSDELNILKLRLACNV